MLYRHALAEGHKAQDAEDDQPSQNTCKAIDSCEDDSIPKMEHYLLCYTAGTGGIKLNMMKWNLRLSYSYNIQALRLGLTKC